MGKISGFRRLEVWQEAHELVLMVYQTAPSYPAGERFGLVSQMRRAAVSIPAHIAGGFKRRVRDKTRFHNISEGSWEESKYLLILSQDLGHISSSASLMAQSETAGHLLDRLIASTERRQ